jgi:hypothetical protein
MRPSLSMSNQPILNEFTVLRNVIMAFTLFVGSMVLFMTWMCTVVSVLLVGRESEPVVVSHDYVSGETHFSIKGGIRPLVQ